MRRTGVRKKMKMVGRRGYQLHADVHTMAGRRSVVERPASSAESGDVGELEQQAYIERLLSDVASM